MKTSLQLSSNQPIRAKTGWKWTNENRERLQFGQSHNPSTTLQVLFSRNTHIQNNTHNQTDNNTRQTTQDLNSVCIFTTLNTRLTVCCLFFKAEQCFWLMCDCVRVLHIPWEGCLCTGTAWRRRRRNLLPDWPALRWQHLSSYLLGERATFKSTLRN